MKLSLVIPCYNMEDYLGFCLDSLYRQDIHLDSYEIIVINDGSKDRTLDVAKDYASKYPNIKIIDKQNAGVGAARNSGMDIAIGKSLYFLDPDDYLADNVLGTLLHIQEKNKLHILTFNSRTLRKEKHWGSFNMGTVVKNPNVQDGITYIASKKFSNEVWWYLVDREFLKSTKLRFIEGRWMEDAIFTAMAFCKAQRMAHVDLDVHRYRLLPTSAMRNKSPEHYNKVIFDNANAAYVYDGIIGSVPKNHPLYFPCIQRLRTRQQSFVFFLSIRLMKSDLPITKIPEMLENFKKIGAYPLNDFLGTDYHGPVYTIMTFVLNHKPLVNPFVKVFRTFYTLVQ